MKPRSLILFLFLLPVAACTETSAPPSPAASAPPPMTAVAAPSPPTVVVDADVVTLDPAAPSVTLRAGDVPRLKAPKASDIKKGDRTIKLEAAAVASLSGIKPGDRVSVTCRQVVAPVVIGAAPSALPSPGAAASPAAASSPAVSASPASGLDLCESIVAITKAAAASPAP
ncbi:MAG: hypothetical protein DMF78_01455 [Acidobacteria bacterium]|nr:MAG: hypothetical protein DMF78_01455 [Acidobacteriota bacterium]